MRGLYIINVHTYTMLGSGVSLLEYLMEDLQGQDSELKVGLGESP